MMQNATIICMAMALGAGGLMVALSSPTFPGLGVGIMTFFAGLELDCLEGRFASGVLTFGEGVMD